MIRELLDLLASAPMLEVATLDFWGGPMLGIEPFGFVTLSKLRKLVWAIRGRFSLPRFLITPELHDLKIRLNYDPTHNDPSIILPPHRDPFPLLIEPTALRYVCYGSTRTWDFTYTSGHLTITESPGLCTRDPPADRWLSENVPISFWSMKELVVEGFDGYPLPRNIPIDQFGSLESLGLVGEADRLLEILKPNGNTSGEVIPVPFLSHLELHPTFHERNFLSELSLMGILIERKEAGHRVKTIRIVGSYHLGEMASELAKFVDVLTLDQIPDSVEH